MWINCSKYSFSGLIRLKINSLLLQESNFLVKLSVMIMIMYGRDLESVLVVFKLNYSIQYTVDWNLMIILANGVINCLRGEFCG